MRAGSERGVSGLPQLQSAATCTGLTKNFQRDMPSILLHRALLFLGLTIASGCWAQLASSGTGFIISKDGLIATNHHVVKGAQTIMIVVGPRGQTTAARVVAVDAANDVALLEADVSRSIEPLALAPSDDVRRGARAMTIGFPRVAIQGAEPKVTDGIVSALSGIESDPRFFQISVPVQPGNSGGPLVGMDGRVIGIVTSQLNALAIAGAGGGVPQNVNYAIKSNYLLELVRPFGVRTAAISSKRGTAPSTFEMLVAHVEQATVLVVANRSSGKAALSAEAVVSRPSDPPPVEQGGLEFEGIKFARRAKNLYVEDTAASSAPTTLQPGDQLIRCYYAAGDEPRPRFVEYPVDMAVCLNPLHDREFSFLVRRSGQETQATLGKR